MRTTSDAMPQVSRGARRRPRFVAGWLTALMVAAVTTLIAPAASIAAPGSVDIRSTAGTDTAEQRSNGSMYLDSSDFEFFTDGGVQQTVGVRFPSVTIPNGSTITNAWIEFTADLTSSTTTTFNIRSETSAAPATFSSATNNMTSRPTTGPVTWNVPAWQSGTAYQSPSLTSIVQTTVDGSWQSGNALVFVIDGTGTRRSHTNQDGTANAPRLFVAYDAPGNPVQTVNVRVGSSSDDAEERASGVVTLDSSDLELSTDGSAVQTIGVRFAGVAVPAGATVTDAWIEFQTDEVSTGATSLTIRGEANSNPGTFTSASGNVSSRTRTAAITPWSNVSAWNTVGATHQTPSLTGVVQELVSAAGWSSGNAMAFLVEGTGRRTAEAYDETPTQGPLLHIAYTTGEPPFVPSPLLINEIKMFGPAAEHWVELVNTSNQPFDATGHEVCSNNDCQLIESGIVPANGYLIVQDLDLAFTSNNRARLWDTRPTPRVVVEEFFWTQSSVESTSFPTGTYGRCPDTSGPIDVTLEATPGAVNVCAGQSPILINEIYQQGTFDQHWVELYNNSDVALDLLGHQICASGDCNYLESGTIAPRGVFLSQDLDVSFVPNSYVRVYDERPGAAVRTLDEFTFTDLAATSYGRCPNGSGPMVLTASVTPSAPNDCGGSAATLEVRVSNGNDDAEEASGGAVVLSSSDLELVQDGGNHQVIGIRFQGVTIPAGATITNAWIEFETDEISTGASSLTFRGHDAANAAAFTTANGNVSSRTPTAATVAWSSVPTWPTADVKHQSPSLTPIVAEIVSNTGWASGNAMVFVVTGSGRRTAEAFEGEPAAAPLLHVEYTSTGPGPTGPPPSGAWPGSGTNASYSFVTGNDWSGLTYVPTSAGNGTLWAIQNGPGVLARVERSNSSWGTLATWTLRESGSSNTIDAEGVTAAEPNDSIIYVAAERYGGSIDNSVRSFDTSNGGSVLNAVNKWTIPGITGGANTGLESITWIPDTHLTNLVGDNGSAYNPAAYPNHGTGLFVLGVESDNVLRFVALNHSNNSVSIVATVTVSGMAYIPGMEYDMDTQLLWATCDNGCSSSHRAVLLELNDATGDFEVIRNYAAPSGHSSYNNEGFALAPVSECSSGTRWALWSDDGTSSTPIREVDTTVGCA